MTAADHAAARSDDVSGIWNARGQYLGDVIIFHDATFTL